MNMHPTQGRRQSLTSNSNKEEAERCLLLCYPEKTPPNPWQAFSSRPGYPNILRDTGRSGSDSSPWMLCKHCKEHSSTEMIEEKVTERTTQLHYSSLCQTALQDSHPHSHSFQAEPSPPKYPKRRPIPTTLYNTSAIHELARRPRSIKKPFLNLASRHPTPSPT